MLSTHLFLFSLGKNLNNEVVEGLELLWLVVTFLEVEEAAVGNHEESLFPRVVHTIRPLEYWPSSEKLNQWVFYHHLGVSLIDLLQLVVKDNIGLLGAKDFVVESKIDL